jgi:hypothetical protein
MPLPRHLRVRSCLPAMRPPRSGASTSNRKRHERVTPRERRIPTHLPLPGRPSGRWPTSARPLLECRPAARLMCSRHVAETRDAALAVPAAARRVRVTLALARSSAPSADRFARLLRSTTRSARMTTPATTDDCQSAPPDVASVVPDSLTPGADQGTPATTDEEERDSKRRRVELPAEPRVPHDREPSHRDETPSAESAVAVVPASGDSLMHSTVSAADSCANNSDDSTASRATPPMDVDSPVQQVASEACPASASHDEAHVPVSHVRVASLVVQQPSAARAVRARSCLVDMPAANPAHESAQFRSASCAAHFPRQTTQTKMVRLAGKPLAAGKKIRQRRVSQKIFTLYLRSCVWIYMHY